MNSTHRKASTANNTQTPEKSVIQVHGTITDVHSDEETVTWIIECHDGKTYQKQSNLRSAKSVDYLRKELQKLGFPGVGNPLDFNYRDLIGIDLTIQVESQDPYPFPKVFIVKRKYKMAIPATQQPIGEETMQITESTKQPTADVEKIKRLFAELSAEVAKLN